MSKYNCYCCNNFNAISFNHLLRHLNKQKNCMTEKKNEHSGIDLINKYTEDELLVMSLLPIENNLKDNIKDNNEYNIKIFQKKKIN